MNSPIDINLLAIENGWTLRDHQQQQSLVIFTKGGSQVNVWYSRMTVGTLIDHPTQKRNMLFRRNVSDKELKDIFANPRVHTGKGYRLATPNTFVKTERVRPIEYDEGRWSKPSLWARLRYLFTGKP